MKVKLTLASNMSVAVSVTMVSPGWTAVSVNTSSPGCPLVSVDSYRSMLAFTTASSSDLATIDNISPGSKFVSPNTPPSDTISAS